MIQAAKYTDIGGRAINEDSCDVFLQVYEDRTDVLAVVADGLGGHGGGDIASTTAVVMLSDFFLLDSSPSKETVESWIQQINERIYSLQNKDVRMKTTITVLALNDFSGFMAHVGDSRIYHFIDNSMHSVTFDHSVSQMAVLTGEITFEQIRHHQDRNKLLRALGSSDEVRVEMSEKFDLQQGNHAFLMCTDGFWENIIEEEMEQTLSVSATPQQWLEQMVTIIKSRVDSNCDNFSAVAVWVYN